MFFKLRLVIKLSCSSWERLLQTSGNFIVAYDSNGSWNYCGFGAREWTEKVQLSTGVDRNW